MAKIQLQWFWNFHLEEPEGNKWDEVERRRTLFKRERSKSVVFTAKEPEKISNDYCAGVDGDNDGDVYGEDDVDDGEVGEDDKEPSHLATRDQLLLLGSAPEDDGQEEEGEGQVHLLEMVFVICKWCSNTNSHTFVYMQARSQIQRQIEILTTIEGIAYAIQVV